MSSENAGRPSNEEIHSRRAKVKEMMLKEIPHKTMAQELRVSLNTVLADVNYWNTYFKKLALNNPQIAERQVAKIEKLIAEISLVKQQYWHIYEELLQKVEENKQVMSKWETEVTDIKKQMADAVANNNGQEKRRLEKLLKDVIRPPKLPSYYTNRLDTLKAILERIDKEAKLLNLFNPATQLQKNYVSLDTMRQVMMTIKNLIVDMIPENQRKYAFERMRKINIEEINPEDILDAEIVEPKKEKIAFKKVEVSAEPINTPESNPVDPVPPNTSNTVAEPPVKTSESDPEDLNNLDI